MSRKNALRQNVKVSIDQAIQANVEPTPPRNGIGLSLSMGTGRSQNLIDDNGNLTAAGRYYYDQVGINPPDKFNFQQDAKRRGRTQYIKLLNGEEKAEQALQATQSNH